MDSLVENILYNLGKYYGTDKASDTKHNYTNIYNDIFYSNRKNIKKLLEIGVLNGKSLYMWRDYFENAIIYGIDCEPKNFNEDRIIFKRCNQENRQKLEETMKEFGEEFDIIIDDGSHCMDHQQISLGFLFKYLSKKGIYIIEDIGTSIDYQKERFHIDRDGLNSTLRMLQKFIKTKKIKSYYINQDEIKYLENNIKSCEIYNVGGENNGITAIIRK